VTSISLVGSGGRFRVSGSVDDVSIVTEIPDRGPLKPPSLGSFVDIDCSRRVFDGSHVPQSNMFNQSGEWCVPRVALS